jgi:hypothetical protein
VNIDNLKHVTKEFFEKYYHTQWRKLPFSNKTCPSPYAIPDNMVRVDDRHNRNVNIR